MKPRGRFAYQVAIANSIVDHMMTAFSMDCLALKYLLANQFFPHQI